MKKRRNVALLIETSNEYARGLLQGIASYIRQHEEWTVLLPEQERGARPPAWLGVWEGDGIIARIENEEIADAVRSTNLPTVDVSSARYLPDIPWVETDDRAIANLAAEHLIERGFRHFGFSGVEGFNWSLWRERYFVEHVESHGYTCLTHRAPNRDRPDYSWSCEHERLRAWLRELPKPMGVFACYDIQAQQLLDACRVEDVAVPEQVAVIGVDNDHLLCELAMPPLSSVAPDSFRSGYESASLLDRIMNGEDVTNNARLVAPLGVITRQSTDVLAIGDPEVAKAARFIRENACSGIKVGDVLRQVDVSRRVLESRFQKLIGRTPHEEIVRYRIARVKHLLKETDFSLADIADRAGFRHVEYLTVAFKKQVGVAPSIYRSQQSGPSG